MEDCKESKSIHMGRNLMRARRMREMKQMELATYLNITQQMISQYEKKAVIEHEMMVKFATILNVPVEVLEGMEDNAATSIVVENNNVEVQSGGISNIMGTENEVENNVTNNPLDALVDMHKEMVEVHKEMLKVLAKIAEGK